MEAMAFDGCFWREVDSPFPPGGIGSVTEPNPTQKAAPLAWLRLTLCPLWGASQHSMRQMEQKIHLKCLPSQVLGVEGQGVLHPIGATSGFPQTACTSRDSFFGKFLK